MLMHEIRCSCMVTGGNTVLSRSYCIYGIWLTNGVGLLYSGPTRSTR